MREIVPICSHCKKVREDEQFWEELETYIRRRFDVEFTHSVCPECANKLYPDLKVHRKAFKQL